LEANRKITEGSTLQIAGIILTGAFGISSIFDIAVTLKKRGPRRKGKVGVSKIPTDAEKKKETEESQSKQKQYYELRRENKEKRKRKRVAKG
jgi:hypothetical protein